MRIDYGQGEKEVLFSVYTMTLYEQEFRSDPIHDLYQGEFNDVYFPAVAKLLWAGLKAADDAIPSFDKWARQVSGVNLREISNEMIPEVNDAFFRAGASDSE